MSENKTYETKKTVEAEPVTAAPADGGRRVLRFDTMIVGILLIALGGFLLYTNYDHKFDFRELVMTWWPLVFVLIGVIKIIQSMLGVSSKGSGVGWLVFGGIIMFLMNGIFWTDWDDDFHFGFMTFSHKVKEDSRVVELDGQTKLMLDLKRTDVQIYGYTGDKIRITEKVFIRGRDKDELESKAEDYKLDVNKTDDLVTLVSNPLKNVKSVNSIYVELEIEIPETMEVELIGERSDLYVKELDGAMLIKIQGGDVTLDRLDGDVDISLSKGDVELHKLIGDVKITGKRLDIEMVDVYGNLIIDTERSAVELTNYQPLENGIDITTSRASVELNLDTDSSFDFEGTTASGNVYYEFDDEDLRERHSYSQKENDGKHKVIVKTSSASITVEEI